MEITTEMIKQLREATGAGILDCRKALEDADGDMEKAMDYSARERPGWLPSARTARPPKAWWSCIPTAMDAWV